MKNAWSGSLVRLLLDTQFLVWMVNGDRRLRPDWIKALVSQETSLHVSPVVAFEFADLQQRHRLPIDEALAELIERFDLVIEDFPAECWQLASEMPPIHRDPVDRMLVAHAIKGNFVLATADANIRQYPVRTI
jgi:PIN domain nuclease of toxin-antitoxin system